MASGNLLLEVHDKVQYIQGAVPQWFSAAIWTTQSGLAIASLYSAVGSASAVLPPRKKSQQSSGPAGSRTFRASARAETGETSASVHCKWASSASAEVIDTLPSALASQMLKDQCSSQEQAKTDPKS